MEEERPSGLFRVLVWAAFAAGIIGALIVYANGGGDGL